MDRIVAGTVTMEQSTLKQVCLARATGLVHSDLQIVVTLPMGPFHSAQHIALGATYISQPALALEHVHTW